MSEQLVLGGMKPEDVDAAILREKDFERRWGEYWAHSNTIWGAERLKRTVVGIVKELLLAAEENHCTPAKIGALKGAGEFCLKLLNKYEPDLRAVELTGNVGVSHEDELSQLESAVRTAEQAAKQLPAVRSDVPENPH